MPVKAGMANSCRLRFDIFMHNMYYCYTIMGEWKSNIVINAIFVKAF